MTYDELLKRGRDMGPAEIADSLKGLSLDPRFAAVLAVIDRLKNDTADAAADLAFADRPGALQHAAGCRYSLRMLEGRIKEAANPKAKTGMQRPGEERP